MKLYNSYLKKSQTGSAEDLILIKNGFSYPAFFFTPLWIIHHKMWKELFALIFIFLAFHLLHQQTLLNNGDILSVYFSLALMIGVNANYWYSELLSNDNYQFMGCIFGKSSEAAKVKFIDNYLQDERNGFADSIFDVRKKSAENYFTI
jgi:hypothetical protein